MVSGWYHPIPSLGEPPAQISEPPKKWWSAFLSVLSRRGASYVTKLTDLYDRRVVLPLGDLIPRIAIFKFTLVPNIGKSVESMVPGGTKVVSLYTGWASPPPKFQSLLKSGGVLFFWCFQDMWQAMSLT